MAERKPLGTGSNSRNHAVTAILAGLAATALHAKYPQLTQAQWLIVTGAGLGTSLGALGSVGRTWTEVMGGETLTKRLVKRVVKWIG
jgi:hypothetical protein